MTIAPSESAAFEAARPPVDAYASNQAPIRSAIRFRGEVRARRARSLLRPEPFLVSAVVLVAAVAACSFGIRLRPVVVGSLLAGALAVLRWPHRRNELACAVGFLALGLVNPVFAAFHAAVVVSLFAVRRSSWRLLIVAALACLVLPKVLFRAHYHQPGFYNWLSEPSLALTFFVTVYLWRQQRDRRAPAEPAGSPFASFGLLYWLPGHIANPMVFGPSELWARPRHDLRAMLSTAGRLALKAGLVLVWQQGAERWSYAALATTPWAQQGRASLWAVLAWNYGATLLQLSGTAEIAVLLAQAYGFPLAPAFRWAFLAWNPVELWRRWGIYNRRILLALVYFPLGGRKRHRWRNVLLTFLASALLLHSGWFGSKYWSIGPGGWRDESIYFLLQGLAVCACLLTGGGGGPGTLHLSWRRMVGTVGTQAFSAWVHVVVLAQALSLEERLRLMWRCLGG